MNNFISPVTDSSKPSVVPKHLESLTTTVFQSLFAPISPQTTSLNTIKRVLLLDRVPAPTAPNMDEPPYVLQLRHYAISTPVAKSSLPRPLRRLNAASSQSTSQSQRHRLPNLGKLADMSDYLLDPSAAAGFTSGSESEAETDAEVEVLAPRNNKVLSREERQHLRDTQRARIAGQTKTATNGTTEEVPEGSEDEEGETQSAPRPVRSREKERVEKRAVKMTELGPRMTLRLTKVEEGLCGGKILWHEYIHKSRKEEKELDSTWAERNREKEQRRKIQKENVERKKAVQKASRGAAKGDKDEDEDELPDLSGSEADFWDEEADQVDGEDMDVEDEEQE